MMANWKHEIEVRVNGKPCAPPHCQAVNAGSYRQYMSVNARALLGGKCRRQEVKVELRVKPIAPLDFTCSKNSCEPSGDWSDYNGEMCKREGDQCTKKPRYTNPGQVHTFVSYAIAF